ASSDESWRQSRMVPVRRSAIRFLRAPESSRGPKVLATRSSRPAYNPWSMPPDNPPAEYRFCPYCANPLQNKVLRDGNPPRPWCDACGFVAYLDPKVAACTVSILDGGIVLAKRATPPQRGKWVFPGGFVDRGESVEDTAIRETLEEVNLRVGLTGI